MKKLTGKTVLITGSSSGIGAGVAEGMAREGADVVINYPTEKQADEAAEIVKRLQKTGCRCKAVQADVSLENDSTHLYEEARDFLGQVDILINNAGIAGSATVEQMTVETWDRMMAIHMRGMFLMTCQCLAGMYERDFGRIINTASQLAYKGAPGSAHYTAAKAGIIGFTRSLALEIGQRRVTANCVAPGATSTTLLSSFPQRTLDDIRSAIPLGRFAEVHDIVPTYVFLASDDAAFFQGQCLSPNGGDVFL